MVSGIRYVMPPQWVTHPSPPEIFLSCFSLDITNSASLLGVTQPCPFNPAPKWVAVLTQWSSLTLEFSFFNSFSWNTEILHTVITMTFPIITVDYPYTYTFSPHRPVHCLQCRRPGFNSWVRKIPWRRKWQPTPVSLPAESQGQRSLAGYSSRCCRSWNDLATKITTK